MAKAMAHGSLFTGIGGIDLGFERAGIATAWQVEYNEYAARVLKKHWPGVKRYKDITEIKDGELEYVDIISGGFPCQDISIAGKGAGIIEGARSSLWFEMCRIIGMVRPRYVVVENVAMLLHRGIDTVLGGLAEVGYDAEWRIVSAADLGARHRRERVFIVAYAEGTGTGKDDGGVWPRAEGIGGREGPAVAQPDEERLQRGRRSGVRVFTEDGAPQTLEWCRERNTAGIWNTTVTFPTTTTSAWPMPWRSSGTSETAFTS